jgi:hypothetical protein
MAKIKDDCRTNSVNERSFICIDRHFFSEGFALSEKKGATEKKGAISSNKGGPS